MDWLVLQQLSKLRKPERPAFKALTLLKMAFED